MQKTGPFFKLLLALALVGVPFSTVQGSATDGWSSVGTGIDYQVFSVRGQLQKSNFNVYVARMDRSNQSTFIESGFPSGALGGSRDTIRNMASFYDEALNYWGAPSGETYSWGGRNHVVVSINGDFQVSNTVLLPDKGTIHSGWYDRRYRENTAWSGFVWAKENQQPSQPNKRSAFIGECVTNPPGSQYITFVKSGNTLPILGVNTPRTNGQLILYTPDYGSSTPGNAGSGVEVVVQMSKPAGVIPNGHMTNGTVLSITTTTGGTRIPFDAVVLSGTGTTADALTQNVQRGDEIGITQEIDSWDAPCSKQFGDSKDWTNAYSSIGGAYAFLQDGKIDGNIDNPGATEGAPRTAIAMNADSIFFMVNDGVEKSGGDDGLSYEQLGDFAKNTLQATWGIVEDGGGSSTMVINGKVVNQISNCDKDGCTERPVVNGIMMVVQEPLAQSGILANGYATTTRLTSTLRLGPGTNYGSLGDLPGQTPITILDDTHGINGVLAKGQNWWKISAGSQVGWLAQTAIKTRDLLFPSIFKSFKP
jgi:hypothetical protein